MIPNQSQSDLLKGESTGCVMTLDEAKAIVEKLARSEAWQKIDQMEEEIESNPASFNELTTHHVFTPGIYLR